MSERETTETWVARPPILDAIDVERHAVVEASAGTGKTYTLEHLVVELLLERELPLEQILVVTFTDKATHEMRERVRATLRRVVDARSSDQAAPDSRWLVDEARRRRVRDALAVFDRAPISTIHGFCQRVLSEHAFECARLLRQEQVESREVFGVGFREELRVALADGASLRPVLELALSMYGAERLEAALYRWYVEQGSPEPRFDRAQAGAALARLPGRRQLAPGGFATRMLETALKRNPRKAVPELLRQLAPVVEALAKGASLYEVLLGFWAWAEADAFSGMNALRYVSHYLGRSTDRAVRPLADAFAQLEASAGGPLSVLVAELLPAVVRRLSGRKAEQGQLDFDDMLSMLRDALYAPEGGDALVTELRRRYRVALVDEFQDTDAVQWDIFRKVFFETDAEQRLVVIGDPKQAIYGFRNADVHTYHRAREAIEARGGATVPLTVSYRSSARVVDAINRVLEQGFFSGVNRYPHPVTCGRPERRALGPEGRDVPPVTLLHCVGRPELRTGPVRRALAERVAREIAGLLEGGLSLDDGEGPVPLSPSDIHVLCRSRGDAEDIGAALSAARLPYAFYKQEGLFQTTTAQHIWDLLRAVEDPSDPVRRLQAWLTPFFAVPLERLPECTHAPPDHPLVEPLYAWRRLADQQRFEALFTAILEESGVLRRELFAATDERALTDYGHIFEILLEQAHKGRRSLRDLVARLGAFIDQRELPEGETGNVHRLESERRAVQVLTMHKSKGLEAEVVFLVGGLTEPPEDRLSPKVFHDPAGRRVAWLGPLGDEVKERYERERREEAERLLYVALTRARRKLFVPYFGPPPEGSELAEGVSYDLVPEPEPAAARSQLALAFEEAAAPETSPAPDPQYELKRLSGPYRVLNERLVQLVGEGALDGPDPLFVREEVPVGPRRRGGADPRAALAAWRPPDELLSATHADDTRFAKARRRQAGFDITSYTRMKSLAGGYRAPEREEPPDALVADAVDVALPEEEDTLPGGTSVGVFLHGVLEHAPFERILALPSDAAWREDPELEAVLVREAVTHGIALEHLDVAAALLAKAMRTPLALADGARLERGLASVTHCATELPFLHPVPERGHPPLDAPPPDGDAPLRIERGFIRGVIDLVIENGGRYHVIDYKSDRLPSFEPPALAAHVENNYRVQARLYTLGALRALAIHDAADYEARFGGLLYAFLRGMGEDDAGIYAERPAWRDVLTWEKALTGERPWGYPLPPRRG